MEHQHGWKPMPVLLKIIWILLLIGAFFALFSVFTAPKSGYQFFGTTVYGLWAANSMFIVNILIPVILLIAMFKRYKWTWILGMIVYAFMIINEGFTFMDIDNTVNQLMVSFPEEFMDKVPDLQQIFYLSVVAGIILGLLIDLFFLIVFIIKRKYFTNIEQTPLQPTKPEQE
jgi:drug/metabolite transporter (DMT)-like permease